MVGGLVADDAPRRLGAVLLDVVPEVGLRGVRTTTSTSWMPASASQTMAEELVLGAHGAAMLARVVGVRLDALRLHVLGVELQHLGGLVVDVDDGVEEWAWRLPVG